MKFFGGIGYLQVKNHVSLRLIPYSLIVSSPLVFGGASGGP